MTYVRKTDTLVDDIKTQVRRMKDKALRAFESNTIEYGTALFDAAREAVVVAAFRDAPELRGKVPSSWYKDHARVEMQFVTEDGDCLFKTNIETPSPDPIQLPAIVDTRYYGAEVNVRRSDCPELLKTWLDAANSRNDDRGTVTEQYYLVEEQLIAFMGQHASLNSAIKEMPEIELYVPEAYMTKLRTAVEPRTKKSKSTAVEDLGIDRSVLTSIAIAHRITNA